MVLESEEAVTYLSRCAIWAETLQVWAAVWLAIAIPTIINTAQMEKAARKELAEAHQLWQSGKQAEAVMKYEQLLTNNSQAASSELPIILSHVIDYYAAHDVAKAKKMIERALDRETSLYLSTREALALLEVTKLDRERAQRERQGRLGMTTPQVKEAFANMRTETDVRQVFGDGKKTNWTVQTKEHRTHMARELARAIGSNPNNEDSLTILEQSDFKEMVYDNGDNDIFVYYGGNARNPYILGVETKEHRDRREARNKMLERMSPEERQEYDKAVESFRTMIEDARRKKSH